MNRRLIYILLSFSLLRILMVVGLFHGLPPISHDGWEFHQGGDQIEYFRVAQSIVNGDTVQSKVAIGYPLYLAAFVALFSPDEWSDLVAPVLVVNCLLSIGAIFLIGILANRLTGSVLAAAAAALVWTLHPYMLYAAFSLHSSAAILRDVYVSHSMWFPMLSDSVSAFLFLLGLTFFFSSLKTPWHTWLCGFSTGLASLVRTLNLSEALILCVFYLILRKYKQGIILLACVLIVLTPQLIYNQYCSGNPLLIGYTPETEGQEKIFSFGFLFTFALSIFRRYPLAAAVATLLPVGSSVFVLYFEKERRTGLTLIVSILFAYIILCGSWYAFRLFPYRFLMPVIPLVVIVATVFFRQVYILWTAWRAHLPGRVGEG